MSGTSARRFAARTRRRRFGRAGVVLAAVAVAAVVAAAAWVVGWSQLLVLEQVRVSGVEDPVATEVSVAAAAPLGTPLARVDTAAVGDRVAGLPYVADVDVARSWPSTLVVQVTARAPVARFATAAGEQAVDASGAVFSPITPVDGLPSLEAPDGADAVGVRAAAVGVLAGLPADLAARVTAARATTDADVELVIDDGSTVRWGSPDRTERKAEVLVALLAQQASAYDVSAPERPTIRP
ncbi:MAG TPA: cell division protein FtsQ/DivIB [Jiangellales bacterium]|nr:cell division protein FtsQ/DivIB [Jiangellales bacterium]